MSHISTQKLSELTGLTKRHCQRLLTIGAVPCAVRTSGGHWSIPDNAKVRRWIEKQRGEKHARKAKVYSVPVIPKPFREKKIAVGGDVRQCQNNLRKAARAMQNAIDAAGSNAHAAGLILLAEHAKNQGGKWSRWLAENGISRDDARDLMNFAKWREQGNESTDERMLRKFGVIRSPKNEKHKNPTKGIAVNWPVWAGKLAGHVGELTKRQPVSKWEDDQRDAVAEQLRPIAELYKQIRVD